MQEHHVQAKEFHTVEALLIARPEAARLLGVCLRTLDYLIERGELPVRRVGRRVLIPRAALEQFARRDHGSPAGARRSSTAHKAGP